MGGMLLAGMHNGERCYCIKRTEQHKIGKPALFGGGLRIEKRRRQNRRNQNISTQRNRVLATLQLISMVRRIRGRDVR